MAAGLFGADVEQLRAAAEEFDRCAERLGSVRTVLTAQLAQAPWRGQDAGEFRSSWDTSHAPKVTDAATRLREAAAVLRRNADAQETTSAVDGGPASGTGATGGSAAGGQDSAGDVGYPPPGATPEDVRDWWTGLSDQQRQDLITNDSIHVGNLNGVPLEDRVEANRLTAEDRLAQDGLSAEERAYLEKVVSRDRQLAVYDPGAERIVEMIGTPGPNTRNVLTYVPGTDAAMGSYYDGSVQQVATYLAQRDRTGGTVAFVYKDGPWAEWNPFSDRSNASTAFAITEGKQLSAFQDALLSDPNLGGAQYSGLAHSAGMSVLAASEMAGAHYDKELSLGGSWLPSGWAADQGTDYHHYQYGTDAINALDPVKDTPHESSLFTQHKYTPDTFEVLGVEVQNPGANHGRIAEGPRSNQEALNQMYKDIHSE